MAAGGDINTDILSDETFELLCTMCTNHGKNTEAEKFCVDCHDYYCATCVKVHSQVPLLMSHKIMDKEQFQLGSSQVLPMAPTQRCDRHSHKHIDMYCQNHDDVGCSTCMSADHRSCTAVYYIPDFIQNNSITVVSSNTQQKLEFVAKILSTQNDKLQQEKQRLLREKASLLDAIRKFGKEINDRLDVLEQNTVAETESKFKSLIGGIEEEMTQLQANKANVRTAKEKVTSVNTNVSHVFVNVKMGERVARNAAECIEGNKTRIIEDIDFTADRKLVNLLRETSTLNNVKERNCGNFKTVRFFLQQYEEKYTLDRYEQARALYDDVW